MRINSGNCMRFQDLPRLASLLWARLGPLVCKGEWRFTDEGKDYLGLITLKMGNGRIMSDVSHYYFEEHVGLPS